MKFESLQAWLDWQAELHPRNIDLGLQRVHAVAERLGVLRPAPTVITVGGTNGKGSSVALLETALRLAGQRVVAYTSPHLHAYNERIRLDGAPASDAAIMRAFEAIEGARSDTSLTYFEFGTLAALWLAQAHAASVVVLEVGLGGRLDAVNIVDADVALVTSIGLDHVEWLGNDLDSIGREKAGIARAGRPFVVAQPEAPTGLLEAASARGARLICAGRDFDFEATEADWCWKMGEVNLTGLPLPALPGRHQIQNAAGVLAALSCLPPDLRPAEPIIRKALREVRLAGRFERIAQGFEVIFDVAHNADGARVLASTLAAMPCAGVTRAVFGVMRDKDAGAMLGELAAQIDEWFLVEPQVDRALPVGELGRCLREAAHDAAFHLVGPVAEGFQRASRGLTASDRLVVTGSFYTVAEARRLLL